MSGTCVRIWNRLAHRMRTGCSVLLFAVRTVWQASPMLTVLLIVIAVANGVMPVASIWVGKRVLDAIVSAVRSEWDPEAAIAAYQCLVLQLFVLLGTLSIQRGNSFLTEVMGKRLSIHMNKGILEKASSLDLATFEDPGFHDRMARGRTQSRVGPLRMIQRCQGLVAGAVTFVSMSLVVASLSIGLLIVMMVVCVPLLMLLVIFSGRQYRLQYMRTEDMRKASYLSNLLTTRAYIPEIINLDLWNHIISKWLGISLEFHRQDLHLLKRRSLAELSLSALIIGSEVGATGYVLLLSMTALRLSVGEIVMYSRAFAQGLDGLRQGIEGATGIYEDALFLSSLMEFHRVKSQMRLRENTAAMPAAIERIDVQNVTFRYPGAERNVLHNVSISFHRSESTLLVGMNGAGKTTLIKLIMRLYDPNEGRILVNGIDIRQIELRTLYRAVGAIFQDYARFAISARENIGYGCVDALDDQERIERAARMARADTFIDRLPNKYDTILSRMFSNGHELSLGQWQRTCLARLFMKDSPILIFDEPTASLDIETEVRLLQEIDVLSKQRICIFVSHRMFRPGIADQIVVLDGGKVAEAGPYEELIAQKGEFARLHDLYQNKSDAYGVPLRDRMEIGM